MRHDITKHYDRHAREWHVSVMRADGVRVATITPHGARQARRVEASLRKLYDVKAVKQ